MNIEKSEVKNMNKAYDFFLLRQFSEYGSVVSELLKLIEVADEVANAEEWDEPPAYSWSEFVR